MKLSRRGLISVVSALAATTMGFAAPARAADTKEIVYLTPGLDLPFWRYLSKGIEAEAKKAGYSYTALDSHNSAETQLKNAQDAIARGVAGIAISPTDSSTAPSVLALAARAKIPVVVADIGTNSGDYVSFIISDNYQGAHGVGEALAAALKEKGWQDGSVGLVTISQARKNGQARTAGFRDAMKDGRHHQGGRPAADAVLYRRRDVQVHPGHADRQSGHARHVHPDRPAGARRASRHQGGASRRHAARRRLRRHSGIRRSAQEGRDRRLRHAAALSHGR